MFLTGHLNGQQSVCSAVCLQMLEGNSQRVEPTEQSIGRDFGGRDQVVRDNDLRIKVSLRLSDHSRAPNSGCSLTVEPAVWMLLTRPCCFGHLHGRDTCGGSVLA